MPPPDAIVVEDLTVRYDGLVALAGVALRVAPGTAVGIVGPNGAGKSTLLKAIAGLVAPASGTVRVFGQPPRRLAPGTIGYVPQQGEVERDFPLSVRDVVTLGRYPRLGPLRPLRAADRRHVDTALARLDLVPLADRPVGALSGGQRQRVFLARALAQEPRLLLLDEPTSGVDARTEEALREVLRETAAGGLPILMTTHDLDDLDRWFDRVVVVDRRVVADAEPEAIAALAAPAFPRRMRA